MRRPSRRLLFTQATAAAGTGPAGTSSLRPRSTRRLRPSSPCAPSSTISPGCANTTTDGAEQPPAWSIANPTRRSRIRPSAVSKRSIRTGATPSCARRSSAIQVYSLPVSTIICSTSARCRGSVNDATPTVVRKIPMSSIIVRSPDRASPIYRNQRPESTSNRVVPVRACGAGVRAPSSMPGAKPGPPRGRHALPDERSLEGPFHPSSHAAHGEQTLAEGRIMHPRSLVLMLAHGTAVLLASLVGASYATAQEDVRNPRPERLTSVMLVPAGLKWEPEHAAPDQSQIAIFHVDQKTGATELYFRLPPHFHAVRHWHSANETNVVVRGTFIIQHDGGERMTMIAGNSSVMPRRMVHQAWSEDEETI